MKPFITVARAGAPLKPRRATRYFLCIVTACCAALAAGAASSQVYRWVDDSGSVHFSDALPPAGTFRDLEVYEGGEALSPHERRTLEIVAEEARAAGASANAAPPATPQAGTGTAEYETADSDTAESDRLAQIRRAQQSAAGENVRDPCLLSWDPRCYEKNAHNYHPLFGYAPSMVRDLGAETTASVR